MTQLIQASNANRVFIGHNLPDKYANPQLGYRIRWVIVQIDE